MKTARSINHIYATVALTLCCLVSPAFSRDEQPTLERIPGTTVSMRRPNGFEQARKFSGFKNNSTGASIMVAELPGPYSKISAGFTQKDRLKARGITLESSETTKINGKNGLLVKLSQEAMGNTFVKLVAVFGTESNTVLITTACPTSEMTPQTEKELKEILLSVDWKPEEKIDKTSHLTYSVSPVEPFKLAKVVQNLQILTVGGAFPQKSPDQPVFLVAEGLRPISQDLRKAYSMSILRKINQVTDVTELSNEPVTIDGMSGFEILASAKDETSGSQLFLYQTIVYTNDGYYRCLGQVSKTQRDKFEPAFGQMARTLKVKP